MNREAAFARAAKLLFEERDFTAMSRKIFDIARELTAAQSGYIALLSKDSGNHDVLVHESGGLSCPVDPNHPLPFRGLPERAYSLLKPVFQNKFMESIYAGFMPAGHVALKNMLFAPLLVEGRPLGIMGLANKPDDFTPEDCATAGALAELVAIGLKNSVNEQSLRESEQLFRSTVEQSADGILLTDSAMRITEWNLAMEALFCYSREEMIGRHLSEFQLMTMPPPLRSPEMLTRLRHSLEAMQKGGSRDWMDAPHEFQVVGKDGTRKFVHITSFPILLGKEVRFGAIVRDVSDRKSAEEKLRRSEDRYRSIVENMNDGMLIHDFSGTIMDCNDNICRMLGYAREQFCGSNLSRIDSPEAARKIRQNMRNIIDQGKAVFDSEQMRVDGSRVAVNVSARLVSAEGGGVIQSFVRDISERKKAEQALAESEEMFSKAFHASPMASGISDLFTGTMIDVNRSFCSLIGYSREEVIGRSAAELNFWVNPEERNKIIGMVGRSKEGNFLEAKCRAKSGTILSVIVSAEIIVWKGTQCLLVSALDITARKLAEEALRGSEERNRALLNAIPDLIFRIRSDGTIVDFKYDRPEQLLMPSENIKGANAFDLPFSAGDLEVVKKSIAGTLADREMHTFQYSLLMADKRRTYEARAVPEDKETVVVIIRDVTELKAAEENQIKTEKLEAIGALAGGIAHDFNNLLGGVFGYLDMAKELVESGQKNRAVATLGKALAVFERAKGLTQQFLTFSKGGAPQKKIVDLNLLLRQNVSFALSGSAVQSSVDVAADLWPCECDEHQIGQVIDNIAINAKQAMPRGGALTVAAANAEIGAELPPLAAGRYVRISFADNGPGIPRELHQKIFDPFFTTKAKGSGLGLATAYSIVKRHDGHIGLESEPGRGATFTVWLPAAENAADPKERAAPATISLRKGTRVLVMDDEKYMRELACGVLASLGCSVATAKTGEEAVRKFKQAAARKRPFRLVVLDMTVPGGMGGKETAKKLLTLDPAALLVVSSGYSDDPVMADPRSFGFVAAIGKPYKKEEMAKALAGAMGEKSDKGTMRQRQKG